MIKKLYINELERIIKKINPATLSSINKFKIKYKKNYGQYGWNLMRGGITFICKSENRNIFEKNEKYKEFEEEAKYEGEIEEEEDELILTNDEEEFEENEK